MICSTVQVRWRGAGKGRQNRKISVCAGRATCCLRVAARRGAESRRDGGAGVTGSVSTFAAVWLHKQAKLAAA